MHCTKLDQPDLDSPHQELSVCGLGFVVALSGRSGIDFFCVHIPHTQSCYDFLQNEVLLLHAKLGAKLSLLFV